MCFYNDYCEWYASVSELTEHDSGPRVRCEECRCPIAESEWRLHIWQQEHEECQICEDDCSDEFIDREEMQAELADGDAEWAAEQLKILAEHKCAYGETYESYRCLDCHKVLKAIEKAEEEAGCPPHARQPAYGMLWDELREAHDARLYAQKALTMFPELAGNKNLLEVLAANA